MIEIYTANFSDNLINSRSQSSSVLTPQSENRQHSPPLFIEEVAQAKRSDGGVKFILCLSYRAYARYLFLRGFEISPRLTIIGTLSALLRKADTHLAPHRFAEGPSGLLCKAKASVVARFVPASGWKLAYTHNERRQSSLKATHCSFAMATLITNKGSSCLCLTPKL